MNPDESQSKLYASLISAIAETKDVHADSSNPFHKNKYASLGAHLSAIKPVFAKHGLAIVQLPMSDMGMIGVSTKVIHKDGGSLSEFIGVPANAEMTGQQAGALISYLRRYALASIAGVATEDDDAEMDRTVRTSVSSTPSAPSKFIANPNYAGKPLDTKFIVPFGDKKGTSLAMLPLRGERGVKCGDLHYWAKVWTPKPFGDSTEPSAKDLALKAEAVKLYDLASTATAPTEETAPATQDEVPF